MRSQAVQHWILACVVVATVLWLDLITADLLYRIALFSLAWAGASTLLVASVGALVALARMRHTHRHHHQHGL
jgi:hypothetical protein